MPRRDAHWPPVGVVVVVVEKAVVKLTSSKADLVAGAASNTSMAHDAPAPLVCSGGHG